MGKTAQAHTTAGEVQGAGPRPGQNSALLSSDETRKRTSRWPQIPQGANWGCSVVLGIWAAGLWGLEGGDTSLPRPSP